MAADAKTIKSVFLGAIDRTPGADRCAYLNEACGENPELRQRVEDLLRSHDARDPLLDQPAARHLDTDGDLEPLDFLEPADGVLGRLGHYEVQEVIGRGGMGVVMRAFDRKLLRMVAIKALKPALAGSRESRQRFVREAQAAAAVTHENVISIHAVEDGGRVPYIVMQFIDGCTLQQKLDRGVPLPVKEVLRIGLQLSEGLAAAHRQGLIHRDIKPANILLENGVARVRITDFGLARAADDASLTRSGVIAGTPAYMAPEQANGERVDHRCDLFSLGSVLYAMMAGAPPFQADTTMAILKRVCEQTPRPLRELNPETPEWLQNLIARLHVKSPDERLGSAAEAAAVLRQRLAELQGSEEFPRSDDRTGESKPVATTHRPRRIAARIGAGLLVVALPIACGLGYQIWKQNHGNSVSTETSEIRGPRQANSSTASESIAASTLPAEPVILKPHQTLMQHIAGVRSLAITRDGRWLASGGMDRNIFLWDTASWQARGPLQGHSGHVSALAFSPDGAHLASATSSPDKYFLRIWNVAEGKLNTEIGADNAGMWDVAYSPDGKTLACGGWDKTLHLIDVESGNERQVISNVASRYLRMLSFSTDGLRIATGGTGPTLIWNTVTANEIPLRVKLPEGMCPIMIPGGKRIAGWQHDDGRVTLCDAATGQVQASWRAHPQRIEGIALSADGRFLASYGSEGIARIWSTDTHKEVARLIGHQGAILAAVFSPDGEWLMSGGEQDSHIHIWKLPTFCKTAK